jgi:hypothetical protein
MSMENPARSLQRFLTLQAACAHHRHPHQRSDDHHAFGAQHQGRSSLLLSSLVVAATTLLFALQPAAAQSVTETCGVFITEPGQEAVHVPLAGYSITNSELPLTAPGRQQHITGVICDRLALELRAQDHRVLTDLRVPFYIRSGIRIAALEAPEGQFRIRFLEGQPSEAERTQLAEALDRATDEVEARAASNAGR